MPAKIIRVLPSLLAVLLFFAFILIDPAHGYPDNICGLIGQDPLLMLRNRTSGELYVQSLMPPDNETTTNELPPQRQLRRTMPTDTLALIDQRNLFIGDEVVALVRACPCTQEVHYCELENDICEVTDTGEHICWKTSVSQFISNLFPFVFFWLGILLIILVCTRRGRDAKAYMIRGAMRCCRWRQNAATEPIEQDLSLNRELDRLLTYSPDRIVQLARLYRTRTRREQARAFVRQQAANGGGIGGTLAGTESMILQQQQQQANNDEEPEVIETTLQPSLMLKTRKYHATTINTDDDDEDDNNMCIICLGTIQEGSRVGSLLSCHHDFHVDCLKDWLKRKNHCPLCNERAAELRYTAGVNTADDDDEDAIQS